MLASVSLHGFIKWIQLWVPGVTINISINYNAFYLYSTFHGPAQSHRALTLQYNQITNVTKQGRWLNKKCV